MKHWPTKRTIPVIFLFLLIFSLILWGTGCDSGTSSSSSSSSSTSSTGGCDTGSSSSSSSSTSSSNSSSTSSSSSSSSGGSYVTTTLQAENAAIIAGVVESEHSGYTGSGYANSDNDVGNYIEFALTASNAATYDLTFYYAVASGNRYASLQVNGTTQVSNIDFNGTGAWTTWGTASVTVNLSSGDNTIRVKAEQSGGLPNIDKLEIYGFAVTEIDMSGNGGGNTPVTVYIAGDSTVSTYTDTSSTTDQAGWGQMLHRNYNSYVTVDNRAIGGRTARWFYMEGRVDGILSSINQGDYLLVQFGHNDSHTTATFTVDGVTYPRYADPDTDFKTYLYQYYILPARAHGAIPVLVTPPPRNSAYCTGGNSLARWAQAMRELGAAYNVAVVDLNQKALGYLMPICPSPTPENFFFIKSDGTVDGTHFQENGARILAAFVAQGIKELGLGLADYGF